MQKRTAIAIGAIAGLAILAFFAVQAIQNNLAERVRPVQMANDILNTQVAQLLNPSPTVIPDPVTYIREIRALARLETIQYSIEKVIRAESGQGPFGFLFGDRLLFVAHGTVIAGIDLEKLAPEDLRLVNGVLYVRLPDSEIFVATLDNEKSYVYDRDTGLLSRGDINLESTARAAAEQEIRKAALEDGILELAMQNAEIYLARFFRALGYQQVEFDDG